MGRKRGKAVFGFLSFQHTFYLCQFYLSQTAWLPSWGAQIPEKQLLLQKKWLKSASKGGIHSQWGAFFLFFFFLEKAAGSSGRRVRKGSPAPHGLFPSVRLERAPPPPRLPQAEWNRSAARVEPLPSTLPSHWPREAASFIGPFPFTDKDKTILRKAFVSSWLFSF